MKITENEGDNREKAKTPMSNFYKKMLRSQLVMKIKRLKCTVNQKSLHIRRKSYNYHSNCVNKLPVTG